VATPRFDLPTIEGDTREFWDGLRDGKLLLRRCTACRAVHYYPRPFCPSCWSADVEWVEAGGGGHVYTYSMVHRNDLPPFQQQVPYLAAIVELDEGPRIMSRLVDVEGDAVDIGLPVQADFTALTDDISIVVFRPA
jgi:uncharacterized protein